MKATRTLLAVLLILGTAGITFSKPVTENLAKQVALNAWLEKVHPVNPDHPAPVIGDSHLVTTITGSPLFYIFNIAGEQGFIVISADDRMVPVLAWSVNGPYRDVNRPPAFEWLMKTLEDQAALAVTTEEKAGPNADAEWERYSAPAFIPEKVLDVFPLLQTTWDQGCFYNEQCPTDASASGSCFHALTGCGATAMAQILKFWASPAHGTGSKSYTHPVYGTLYANFATATYNYAFMPLSLASGNAEVAQLIYHCGIAQEMDYGPSSSASDILAIDAALRDYFDYNADLSWKARADFSSSTWTTMLKTELDAGRPLLYYGNDNGAVGHAFVCDGYQGTAYFHINWGWSGSYDGYFYLDNLTPGGSVYTDNQQAIFDLRPNQVPGVETMDFESVTDFSMTFAPWTVADVDGKPTYAITNYSFPHQGEAMAYIAFNPAQVNPPMTSDPEIQPHGGSRFGACFSATTPSNSDWFISPQIQMNINGSFSLWVKSYTAAYGLEKYKVAVSTTNNNPASFSVISGTAPLLAPTDWTQKTFGLSAYNGQLIYVAVQCVSDTAFIFMIDDLVVDPGGTGSLVADFSADHTTINQGENVNFTDASFGNPTSWQWTFQGGTPSTSTAQNPSNIRYNNPGTYDVTLTVNDGTSSNTKTRTGYINVTQMFPSEMSLDFESLADFTTQFNPWTTADVNGGNTYNISGVSFPGSGNPMAWICFNPSATTPPLTNTSAHSGVRFGGSFSSPPPFAPSNKWLITPKMFLGSNGKLELWVKSYTSDYGLEKYNIGVSETGNLPSDFTIVSGINPEEAPVVWTKKTYSLSSFASKEIYIGIQCVSNDAFIFMIDDILISSTVGVDEQSASPAMVYPNPASEKFYVRFMADAPSSFSGELYNAIGSKVSAFRTEVPGTLPFPVDVKGLPEGIYFLKLTYGSSTIIKKVILVD